MLTSTYSLIVFSEEQTSIRTKIAALRDHIQQVLKDASILDSKIAESVLTQLNDFHDCVHYRRVDIYLVSRMRKMSWHAASLLAELESLSLLSLNMLRSVKEKMMKAIKRGGAVLAEVQDAVELYCGTLSNKIEKEEKELFPMAVQLLTPEDWFQIARQLLSHNVKIGDKGNAMGVPIAPRATSAFLDQARSYAITIPKNWDSERGGTSIRQLAIANAAGQACVSPQAIGAMQNGEAASAYRNCSRQHA